MFSIDFLPEGFNLHPVTSVWTLYEQVQAFRLWFNKVLKHLPGLALQNLLIESSRKIAAGLTGNESELWTIKQLLSSTAAVTTLQWRAGCESGEQFTMGLGTWRVKAALQQPHPATEFTSPDNTPAGPQPPTSW